MLFSLSHGFSFPINLGPCFFMSEYVFLRPEVGCFFFQKNRGFCLVTFLKLFMCCFVFMSVFLKSAILR